MFTFECKSFFKAYRIVEGSLDLSLIFAFPVAIIQPIFGSNRSLEGKPLSKLINSSIAVLNFQSTSSDVRSAFAADFSASSAAINKLFISQWMGNSTDKTKTRHSLNRKKEFGHFLYSWTTNRHKNISFMAKFWYALESVFNDLTNERSSNTKFPGRMCFGLVIRLDNDKIE